MDEIVNVLGYKGHIVKASDGFIVLFFHHDETCRAISELYKCNHDGPKWSQLLEKYYHKSRSINNIVLFPVFDTINELKSFIISLNTGFLINIV